MTAEPLERAATAWRLAARRVAHLSRVLRSVREPRCDTPPVRLVKLLRRALVHGWRVDFPS